MDDGALPAGWQPFTVTVGNRIARVAAGSGSRRRVHARRRRRRARRRPRYDEGSTVPRPMPGAPAPIPAELAVILATIRHMETGGNYTVAVATSTASGAYGFLDSSWGGYGGYARAKDAPPGCRTPRRPSWPRTS